MAKTGAIILKSLGMDVKITVINVGNTGNAISQDLLKSVVSSPKDLVNLNESEELGKTTLQLKISEDVCSSE